MWYQLDNWEILGSTRNQDVRMGRVVRVILTLRAEVSLRKAGWMVKYSWYYEERLKELGILILERIFKGHIITIQKYLRSP